MSESTFFKKDSRGRTTLFYAAELGDFDSVKAITGKLMGTGVCCQRLALINIKDNDDKTAIDAAREAGQQEIAAYLESEKMRMEFFE